MPVINEAWLRQWYLAGLTLRDIAGMIGCSTTTVYTALSRYSIPTRKRGAHNKPGVHSLTAEKAIVLAGAQEALEVVQAAREKGAAREDRRRSRKKRRERGRRAREAAYEAEDAAAEAAAEQKCPDTKVREAFEDLMQPVKPPRSRFRSALKKASDAGERR